MDNALLEDITRGESQSIEFKTSFQKEVIETVVAFANATGGKIFIGVSDNGVIVGTEVRQESMQNWINQIKLSTVPSVIPDISIETLDEKTIVVIDVKEYPIKPISYKNRYFLRRVNSNHLMSMDEIANEYLKTKNSSWDYYVDEGQTFENISFEKIDGFISRIEKKNGEKFDDSPTQILKKYDLVRDEKITFGAYLLFVKDFCLISGVQAGRFKTPTDIIDSISLNTDILTEIDELIIFLRKHMMVEYIITGNPQREERYDYPLDAIREVVLNMIVHRDYRDSSDSIIKIFDDRIEFFNPGDLYDGLTVEQLESNNYKSKTRNKLIALMFKECGLIEKYGSGIGRVKKLCKEHGVIEPKFQEIQKGFQVTLYKKKLEDEGVSEGVNEGVKSLYELIRNYPNNKTPFFAKELNTSVKNIERWIKQLRGDGKIAFIGSPKTGGYFVR